MLADWKKLAGSLERVLIRTLYVIGIIALDSTVLVFGILVDRGIQRYWSDNIVYLGIARRIEQVFFVVLFVVFLAIDLADFIRENRGATSRGEPTVESQVAGKHDQATNIGR